MQIKISLYADIKKDINDFLDWTDRRADAVSDFFKEERKKDEERKEFEKTLLEDKTYVRFWWIWAISFCLMLLTFVLDEPWYSMFKSLTPIFFLIFLISFFLSIWYYNKRRKES